MNRSLGGCQYHVAHPGGRNYDDLPGQRLRGRGRRLARFFRTGHTPGTLTFAAEALNPEFPFTLDLRRPAVGVVAFVCSGPMLDQLLAGYAAPEGRFDELLAAPGRPRPHWDAFLRALAERSEREVSDTLSLTERQIREHGVTYNVYADAQGGDRPWELDPLPLVLPADEWAGDRGRRRAARRLLNASSATSTARRRCSKSGAFRRR